MIQDILSGWKNYLNKSEVSEGIAKQRATICATCEHNKKGMILTFIKDSLKEIEGHYCNDCGGCPLSAKVRTKREVCKKW